MYIVELTNLGFEQKCGFIMKQAELVSTVTVRGHGKCKVFPTARIYLRNTFLEQALFLETLVNSEFKSLKVL
jgi:hypothetical protein